MHGLNLTENLYVGMCGMIFLYEFICLIERHLSEEILSSAHEGFPRSTPFGRDIFNYINKCPAYAGEHRNMELNFYLTFDIVVFNGNQMIVESDEQWAENNFDGVQTFCCLMCDFVVYKIFAYYRR